MKKTILSALLALCTAALLTTVSFAADKTVSSWSELADAIQSTDTSPSITLSCDITAGEGDGEITVSGTSTVRLDLNGHVLDGAMRTRIFLVQDGGRLVITDSDAQKRGALVGGSAEDASVTHSGGGVYVAAGGQLELNGATIRDCRGRMAAARSARRVTSICITARSSRTARPGTPEAAVRCIPPVARPGSLCATPP